MLKKVFKFFAEARHDRMRRYADYYAKDSFKTDKMSNEKLLDAVDKEAFIAIKDIDRAMSSLKHRAAFRMSPYDVEAYVSPVYNGLMKKIETGEVPCYVKPTENVFDFGVIRTNDFLDVLNAAFPPDMDNRTTIYGVQDVPVPIDPDFGDSLLGKLRQKFNDAFPLRTPSTPVRYEQHIEERDVDVRRMFILALGYAGAHNSKSLDDTSLFTDTLKEREAARQNRSRKRTYRGRDY